MSPNSKNDSVKFIISAKCEKKLKNNKSPGNDGITGEMIKHGGPHLIEEIHQTPTGIEPTVVDDDDDDASYQTA